MTPPPFPLQFLFFFSFSSFIFYHPRLAHLLFFRVVLKVTKTVVLLQVEYFFSISCYTMFLTCNKMAMFNKDVARWQCYKLWSAYRRSMSQKGLYFYQLLLQFHALIDSNGLKCYGYGKLCLKFLLLSGEMALPCWITFYLATKWDLWANSTTQSYQKFCVIYSMLEFKHSYCLFQVLSPLSNLFIGSGPLAV